ncbi:hypothetical protein CROQUDRAFT_98103 [Cronartium quercuum f. sp. fusiforme G11]|uniref:RRM domain-containing protein n=1 Tax=Cronartium quercuum f. sp. fusiforme G11 TaxID=708437 RepID=A0A9P6NCY8_9BASI|nr:hypothetical protein CROQUDRAFT_98103 [Cronartium quercuum f. sp. fusiforme G11]
MTSGTGTGYNYYPPSELQAYQASYAASAAAGQQTYSSGPNLSNSYYDPASAAIAAVTGSIGPVPSSSNLDAAFDANVAAQQSIYTPDAVQNPQVVQKANKGKARTTVIRKAGGETWEDQTLMEWDPTHFRLFVGDLAPEVSDDGLAAAFSKWPSFVKARVVRDKVTTKSKGYGFVSYKDPEDFMKAWKEMNGKYVGSRPIKISKATTKVASVNIGSKKARQLDDRKKKPIQGVERLRTGAGAVWKNDNRPYARR